jgi:dihydrofolate reductase
MRKVVVFMHMSLDGFVSDTNGGLEWATYDEELARYADTLVEKVGSPMYGRVTYQLMEGYWPTVLKDPKAGEHSLKHARWVEDVPKVVFSKSLDKVTWNNTRLIKDNIGEEVRKLKEEPGKDLVIFGSPGLVETFHELDLVDEYWLTLHPTALGAGKSLFGNLKKKIDLKQIGSHQLKSGVIAINYETVRNKK